MIYFVSDIHLGLSYKGHSTFERERHFVKWLEGIEGDCEKRFLVGDIFDFWFEWKRVVPKGFVRVLAQLAKMADRGVEINYFVGNHDKWVGDYFEKELGINVYTKGELFDLQGKKVYVVHGDGLGKLDWQSRTLDKLFSSKRARWWFQRVFHPDRAMRFGSSWSESNRAERSYIAHPFKGESEPLVEYAKGLRADVEFDYFVAGHIHINMLYGLDTAQGCTLVFLGEWIVNPSYAVMNNGEFEIRSYI